MKMKVLSLYRLMVCLIIQMILVTGQNVTKKDLQSTTLANLRRRGYQIVDKIGLKAMIGVFGLGLIWDWVNDASIMTLALAVFWFAFSIWMTKLNSQREPDAKIKHA